MAVQRIGASHVAISIAISIYRIKISISHYIDIASLWDIDIASILISHSNIDIDYRIISISHSCDRISIVGSDDVSHK